MEIHHAEQGTEAVWHGNSSASGFASWNYVADLHKL